MSRPREAQHAATSTTGSSLRRGTLTGSAVLTFMASTDVALGARCTLRGLALCVALSMLLGALCGGSWSAFLIATARLQQARRRFACLLVGSTLLAWLLHELQVVPHLFEQRKRIAAAVLVASVLFGALAAWIVHVGQLAATGSRSAPRPDHRRSVLLMLALAIGLVWVDQNLFLELYPSGHAALHLLSAGLLFDVCLLASRRLGARPWVGDSKSWVAGVVALPVLFVGWVPLSFQDFHAMNHREYGRPVLAAARALLDFDLDGYSAALGGGDCAPFVGTTHPFALEVPNNGVDEDCSGRDAEASSPRRADLRPAARRGTGKPPSVLLITVDTLRADRASTAALMPELTAWSRRAVVFEQAQSPSASTLSSLVALCNGRYMRNLPRGRSVWTSGGQIVPREALGALPMRKRAWVIPYPRSEVAQTSMPALLRDAGYRTGAVVAGGGPYLEDPDLSPCVGFDHYTGMAEVPSIAFDDAETTAAALRTLDRISSDGPFFLWVHFFGPHGPANHHASAGPLPLTMAKSYDYEVTYVDQAIAALIREVDARHGDSVMTVVAADHGEHITPGGRWHGTGVSADLIHIPLMIRAPDWRPRHVAWPVSLTDVLPTVLSATGIEAPGSLDGIDLGGAGTNDDALRERVVFSELWKGDSNGAVLPLKIAGLRGTRKVVWDMARNDFASLSIVGLDEQVAPWDAQAHALVDDLRTFALDRELASR